VPHQKHVQLARVVLAFMLSTWVLPLASNAQDSSPSVKFLSDFRDGSLYVSAVIKNESDSVICAGYPFLTPVTVNLYDGTNIRFSGGFENFAEQSAIFPEGSFLFVFPPRTSFTYGYSFKPVGISAPVVPLVEASDEEQRSFGSWQIEARESGVYQVVLSIGLVACPNGVANLVVGRSNPFFVRQDARMFENNRETEFSSESIKIEHSN
jgi:hypothetical protein